MISKKSSYENSYLSTSFSNFLNEVNSKNVKFNSLSQENIFDGDDVERYDADSYRQKYGDRWKKLATSVRDVVQPDGTIIREYVIEDPALLDELSEDDENNNSFKTQLKNNKQIQKSSVSFSNEFKQQNFNLSNIYENLKPNSIQNLNDYKILSGSTEMNQKYSTNNNNNNSKNNINSTEVNTNTNNNNNYNNNNNNNNKNVFQPINPSLNLKSNGTHANENNKLIKDDDEVDKEVEIIHEQGKQLKQVMDANANENSIIEYEILDEHGNQIMINGAEELKKLAACVNEVKQSDGSIVKEYILNDPHVIEQIRNQIKNKSQVFNTTNQQTNANNNINNNNNSNNTNHNNINQNNQRKDYFQSQNVNIVPSRFDQNFQLGKMNNNLASSSVHNVQNVKQNNLSEKNNQKPKIENIETSDRYSPLPSLASTLTTSTPYLSQVKQQIQKFQQQTNQKKIDNNNLNHSKLTNSKSDFTSNIPLNKTNNSQIIQQPKQNDINKNKFEFKTTKGKLLQFVIMNDDVTDNDIEELKSFLAKHYTKLLSDNTESTQTTKLSQSNNSNDNSNYSNYFFQPKPKPLVQNNTTIQHGQITMTKSGSMDNILNTSVTKLDDTTCRTNNKSNLPVYLKYLNHAKSIGNLNMLEQKNDLNNLSRNFQMTKSTENLNGSSRNLDNKKPTPVHVNQENLQPNTKPGQNLNVKFNDKIETNQNKLLINSTYTKSSKTNFNHHLIESGLSNTSTILKQINSKLSSNVENNSKKLNKSLENLDRIEKNKDVSTEMTEQLLLKLLLHQISLQKKQKNEDEDDDRTSFSNDTFSNSSSNSKEKPESYSNQSKFQNSQLNKNKLVHKSMSNFDRLESTESDCEEFEDNYRKISKHLNSQKKQAFNNYF